MLSNRIYLPISYKMEERQIKSSNKHAMGMIYLILFIHILSPYYWADLLFSSHNDLHRSFCLQLINRNSFCDNIRLYCSLPAVEYSKEFVTSIVVGKDVVPRIGLHQMEALRHDLMNALQKSTDPKVVAIWK